MAERKAIERLDEAVDAILAGQRPPALEAEEAVLALIAAGLRDLPDPKFRSTLRNKLVPPKQSIVPYFVVDGADEFIAFMSEAFGAELRTRYTRPDGTVMHAEVGIGDSAVELGNASPQYPPMKLGIHLYVDDVDAVYEKAARAGAKTLHPIMDQPYGDREVSLEDAFGNHWYVATHLATGSKPPGFRSITPFLHPRGADRQIEFLVRAFDAKVLDRTESPDGTVMHATVQVGNSMVEMGEAHGPWRPMPSNLHFFVDDPDRVYERAMAAGATSIFPVTNQPYGERSGGVIDPFGNNWFMAAPLLKA
ncbi:MAG TPA: VOC family protein [Thermoanaerobaculia bacterium]|nr:VOC family protein [Thermoanaerobaculia bacterium]